MRQLAKTERVPLADELFKDEDRSGANVDRPEFQRALGLIRDGKLGGIAVAKLDRFSRDTVDFLTTLRERTARRASCAATGRHRSRTGPTRSPRCASRRPRWTRSAGRGPEEVGPQRARSRRTPQRPVRLRKSRGKGTKLEQHPGEAPVVAEMFELRAAGWTWPRIAAKLNHDGRLPRPHRRWIEADGVRRPEERQAHWVPKGVRQVVMNEVYLGTAFNGEHRTPAAHARS